MTDLLRQKPSVTPPLDDAFRPAYLAHRAFEAGVRESSRAARLSFALVRPGGKVSVHDAVVFDEHDARASLNLIYAERLLKFLLWQKGAAQVLVAGPRPITDLLARTYSNDGARAFDAAFMGNVYERPFAVVAVRESELPVENETSAPIGRHLDGYRIGFDAGGSDRKVAAVIDGKEVFSCEVVWDPKNQSDPQYHFDGIDDSIRRAAQHLPRIDAIGISSAGVYIDNKTRVASLFRKVPPDLFERRIKTIYLDVAQKWGGVPIEVANDGDVTALAGAMSLNDQPVLGLAMGTSQAVGYVDEQGHLTGWLNELAFAPVDYAKEAPLDAEWSLDRGTGVNYFSQDAAIRLAPRAGISLPEEASPGDKLKILQRRLAEGHEGARLVFESIGVYLGYGLLQCAGFYPMKHVLVLGRVTSGEGGAILVRRARDVLATEAPELSGRVRIHLPDEDSRRVGQAIAAASLPVKAGRS